MAARVIRAITAICGKASVTIGRMVLRSAPPFQPPTGSQAEDDLQHGCDDEVRDGDAGGGEAHHGIVGALVLAESRKHAERTANGERQQERRGSQPHRDRQALPEQLGDREVAEIEGRAEIALKQRAEIGQVLRVERLVELVDAAQVRHHLGLQRLFEVERAARRHAHQEERERHHHEQRRDRAQEAEDEGEHVRLARHDRA
jgi:hypothetical protein